jgi:hypothetical protein
MTLCNAPFVEYRVAIATVKTNQQTSTRQPFDVETRGKSSLRFHSTTRGHVREINDDWLNEPGLDMVACSGSVSSDSCLLSIYHWRNSLLANEHDQQRALRKSGMDWEWPYHRISLASHNSALIGC